MTLVPHPSSPSGVPPWPPGHERSHSPSQKSNCRPLGHVAGPLLLRRGDLRARKQRQKEKDQGAHSIVDTGVGFRRRSSVRTGFLSDKGRNRGPFKRKRPGVLWLLLLHARPFSVADTLRGGNL